MANPFAMPPPPPPIAMSEMSIVQSLPPSVQLAVTQMDAQSKNAFFVEYGRKRKKVITARLISFFFGWHYIYLRKTGMQLLYWASWLWLFPGIIWWIVDLIQMDKKVNEANGMVAREIIQSLAIGNQFKNSPLPD